MSNFNLALRLLAVWFFGSCLWGCRPADLPTTAEGPRDGSEFDENAAVETDPRDAIQLEFAADRAAASGETVRSIELLREAIQLSAAPSKSLFDKLGQQWMNMGRPFDTVETLQTAIKSFPSDADLRQKLVSVLASLGMQWEASEHLQWLIQRGHGDLAVLSISADLNRPQTVEATCKFALTKNPSDLRPQFSIAQLRAYYSEWNEVVELLKPVTQQHPTFVPAYALYLRALVELDDEPVLQAATQSFPPGIDSHPHYWLAAGLWSQRRGNQELAATALWHCLELDANNGEALVQLASTLAELGKVEASRAAAARAASVTAVRDNVDLLRTWRNNSQSSAIKLAQTLQGMGRKWEATAWLQVAFGMNQNLDPQLTQIYKTIRGELNGQTPWQSPDALAVIKLDSSQMPVFSWQVTPPSSPVETRVPSAIAIQFEDQSHARGLDHSCEIGKTGATQSSLAIYQSGAGGAGVIDYDLDAWPDLYLTVSDGQPMQADSAPNRLYRNQAGQFQDVTTYTNCGDRGLSQGVAVGDYNADGWADLFIGNIGNNHLYRNNGDGTFTDVTAESGLFGTDWTSSVAIADLDGDGHADLIEVGYCAGDLVYQHKCMDDELQQPRSCSPLAFDAQPDRVWKGLGNGRFEDGSDAWFGPHEPGRGLGIVVGQLDSSAGLDIYIANDMTANHYWTQTLETTSERNPTGSFQLSEQANLRGLAVNERSLSQASMGLAAADADSDGDMDFLVSHFSDDYNTFYEQIGEGLWADRSRRVGLAAPSLDRLGYGTQWFDGDNDGSLELVVANGDIDDFSHKGRAYRQRPQLFQRAEDGGWSELSQMSLGKYFSAEHLGRAVVTLDANRDSRTDILITHLFEPVALLINETVDAGNSIRLFLRGTESHRDAIGARVTIQMGDKTQTQFLIAGNGYQCSTERCIVIGLGKRDHVDRVIVDWPNGKQESFGELQAKKDYLLIEGANDVFELAQP